MINFNKRVREIKPKINSLSGAFISKKRPNDLIQFESSLELDYIYLLEFNPEIKYYIEQPLYIKYVNFKGKTCNYYPDFLVRFNDSQKKDLLVEVKYESDLKANKLFLEEKFKAANQFCDNNCLTFSVLTEVEIRKKRPEYLKNIKFLGRYRNGLDALDRTYEDTQKDIAYTTHIIDKLSDLQKCSIAKLLIELSSNDRDRAELLYYICFLIANFYLGCNLDTNLNLNTEVWIM